VRRALASLIGLFLLVLCAPPASATTLDEVVDALRSDPVYNDPEAENALTDAQADDLRDQIASGGSSVYLAVLPDAARGDNTTEDVVAYLQSGVGEPGAYAAVVGSQFRATESAAATSAFQQQQGNGVYSVLSQFVTNVQATDGGSAGTDPEGSGARSSGGSLAPLLVLTGLAAGAGGLVLVGRRRRRRAQAQALAAVRTTLDEDITAFGESLDTVDSSAISTEEDRADWLAALDQYDAAKRSSQAMTSPEQAATVTEALDEGRYRVACVRARMSGHALPERRPPCFFDPRHGLSIRDVSYAPAGTTRQREVPACAACATAVDDGLDPDVRLVPAGAGGQRPYWQAGPEYGGYASGYYRGSGMDIFSTILVGTMLGNMMTAGMYSGLGAGDWSSASDFGGGDFGGGDFGGGDFGGGDFGGF
jgi:hypothetical protein